MGRLLLFSDRQRGLQELATEKLKGYAKHIRKRPTRIDDKTMREAQALITEAIRLDKEKLP